MKTIDKVVAAGCALVAAPLVAGVIAVAVNAPQEARDRVAAQQKQEEERRAAAVEAAKPKPYEDFEDRVNHLMWMPDTHFWDQQRLNEGVAKEWADGVCERLPDRAAAVQWMDSELWYLRTVKHVAIVGDDVVDAAIENVCPQAGGWG